MDEQDPVQAAPDQENTVGVAQQAPAPEVPAEEASVEEAPAAEAPVAEAPVEETFAPEVPAEEAPDTSEKTAGPVLKHAGHTVVRDITREVEGRTHHSLTLDDGSVTDVTEEEYQAIVDASK